MVTVINNIKAGIETRIESIIPSYTKLSYQLDISKNKFKGNSKGYAVIPSSATEVDSLLGSFTMDHTFNVTLTNSYNNGAASQIGDTLKAQRITEINDDLLTAYKDLVINKGSIDSNVLIINSLSIDEPEFLEDEKVISITFSFNVKYKINK